MAYYNKIIVPDYTSSEIISTSGSDYACGCYAILYWLDIFKPDIEDSMGVNIYKEIKCYYNKMQQPRNSLKYPFQRIPIKDISSNYTQLNKNFFSSGYELNENDIAYYLTIFNIPYIIIDKLQNTAYTSWQIQSNVIDPKNIAVIINKERKHWEPVNSNKKIKINND